MKHLIVTCFILFSHTLFAQAQIKNLKISPSIRGDVEKIAEDYFQNFNNVKGDTLLVFPDHTVFACRIVPAGSLESIITKYSLPNTYSWQASMLKTENFQEASSAYKKYFGQINGMMVHFKSEGSVKLQGQYSAPVEAVAFASSILKPATVYKNLQHFAVEVSMQYSFPEWEVKILSYEKVPDQDVRPGSY